MTPVRCPTGCGSRSFRAVRRAAIVEDFDVEIDTGEIVRRGSLAQGGGRLTINCECGHSWRTSRDLDLALFVEER